MKPVSCLAALLALLALTAPVAAACARPEVLPVELPLMPCPTRAEAAICLACPPGDRLLLVYDGTIGSITAGWIHALADAGWKVTMTVLPLPLAPAAGDAMMQITARHGHDVATTTVRLGGTRVRDDSQTMLAIDFVPG